jgi:hypothetical protein
MMPLTITAEEIDFGLDVIDRNSICDADYQNDHQPEIPARCRSMISSARTHPGQADPGRRRPERDQQNSASARPMRDALLQLDTEGFVTISPPRFS